MPRAGPIIDAALEVLPESSSGSIVDAALETLPTGYAGPIQDNIGGLEVAVPFYGGPTGGSRAAVAPTQTYSGPTEGTSRFPPERGYGGPTESVARFPPPQGYSGPTGGSVPPVEPDHFGGVSGGRAVVTVRTYGGPTGGTVPPIVPPRGFGAGTGGVIVGIEPPMSLTATVIDAGCIRLDWVDPGDPDDPAIPVETGYRVERSLADADDWEIIALLPMDSETYLDRFAVPLVVYDYRVIGFNPDRESNPSNIATAVTPLPPDIATGPPPTAPDDPQRNRIEPKPFTFESPGVYGLEKDEDGDITGFKF